MGQVKKENTNWRWTLINPWISTNMNNHAYHNMNPLIYGVPDWGQWGKYPRKIHESTGAELRCWWGQKEPIWTWRIEAIHPNWSISSLALAPIRSWSFILNPNSPTIESEGSSGKTTWLNPEPWEPKRLFPLKTQVGSRYMKVSTTTPPDCPPAVLAAAPFPEPKLSGETQFTNGKRVWFTADWLF